MSKLWGGRFEKDLNKDVQSFSSSLDVDTRLWQADLDASIAHARMLGQQGILPQSEAQMIVEGLKNVRLEIERAMEAGASPFDPEAEDVHSELERMLRDKIGAVAGKLHTARSRNDQVATACRLTLARETESLCNTIRDLQTWLIETAQAETETMLPGLTHFQHAQPVSLAHHLLAYFWMFSRDHERLIQFRSRCLSLPLGSAALAGTSFPLDRSAVASELGFESLCENSLDAVSDRDFVIEFLSACSILMMHLSRLSEEIIVWTAPEHDFLELDDSVTTGSSIMPQKKNPDVAELIRGKTGRAYGALMGALTMMKALPLAYNRDQQEDKFHLFQGLDVTASSVRLMKTMLEGAIFRREKMAAALNGDFSNATDLADQLARVGIPFREAHEVVGVIVRQCLKTGRALESLALDELREFHSAFDQPSVDLLSHRAVMNARTSRGGTAPKAVLMQLELARQSLAAAQSANLGT
jgi:argininosuccinate lyase